ncbi:DUF3052 domain-containing protein [Gleimia sp. 6138-11-ORH1]|uniref:DUF3052 domain-containing protein n=1 Tax=Gleimia sp. 6138-11-ORH1 TaxID=2973937 RepID=UPI002168B749|nr:DUF3052 domain-containing protein [Gleimia sp. 6138-11-ORH1]MCS4484156.1 DUF3052 domain-containing protein [Gleimia sp. 6138-11-ORH1]
MNDISLSAEADAKPSHNLGFKAGQIVQEFYWDTDVDAQLRDDIMDATGEDIVDGEFSDVVDGVLIWWRADDAEEEDLADVLLDAIANLDDGGDVWVLTPKMGSYGHVRPADIQDAAKVAGLKPTSASKVAPDWAGMRLVASGRK